MQMLRNPLISLKDFESAPHFRKISRQTINAMRLLASQLISSGVKMLKMSHACYCTAEILFQQFFALESLLKYPLMDIVMAAVFVAGKVEECIRRARDIVNVFHHLYCLIRGLPAHPIEYVGDTYYVWRDRLCTAEAILLRTLGFHVQPASPVPLLISYLKLLDLGQIAPELPQLSFACLNDVLRTPAPVLVQPNVLAVCAIHLAAQTLGFSFPREQLVADWFVLFDVNEEELRICREAAMEALGSDGGGEIDLLLPLTREELKIFAEQIGTTEEEEAAEEMEPLKQQQSSPSRQKYNRFHQGSNNNHTRSRSRSRSRDRSRSKYRSNYDNNDYYYYNNDKYNYNSHHRNHRSNGRSSHDTHEHRK